MTRGVLLFATDTDTRRYTDLARYCAKQVKRYLDLPVTLVTNVAISDPLFDRVIVQEAVLAQQRTMGKTGHTETWKNFNRYRAYELSPYDETILLDSDYIVNSTKLLQLFEFGSDFMCHKHRRYLGSHTAGSVETFGRMNQMYWATVVYFNRSEITQNIFQVWRMIQDNYEHYSRIYGFNPSQYRNDYAITIALNTCYGHIIPPEVEIPFKLMNVEFDTAVTKKLDTYELTFTRLVAGEHKPYRITTKNQDLHILNKNALAQIIEADV